MVIFSGTEGLGNEIFQYAFLKKIARPKEKILCIGGFEHLVECFELNDEYFRLIIINGFNLKIFVKVFFPILKFLSKIRIISLISQDYKKDIPTQTYSFLKGLMPIKLVETGFFQGEIFVKKDLSLSFKEVFLSRAKEILSFTPVKSTPVFIHVRRGDYLFENFSDIDGVELPLSYFEKAIKIIKDELKEPYFFILSDDLVYIKNNFQFLEQNKMYISSENAYVDLALMSLCGYGICSNSSFSWFGYYLASSKMKYIFPKYWFGWKSRTESHPGIQPKGTIIINPN